MENELHAMYMTRQLWYNVCKREVSAMDWMEAIRARHSVRSYTDRKIEGAALEGLRAEMDACSREGRLTMELRLEETLAFSSFLAHYGLFKGARNYVVISGRPADDLDERVGYYGERLVLRAQQLGLNTCWVGGTYRKGKVQQEIPEGEKLVCVIVIGYGANQGKSHRSKALEKLYRCEGPVPEWFRRGVEAAQLAPTAINQQMFRFELNGNVVTAKSLLGPYAKVDLGIVRLHFEIGAGREGWRWA